MALTEVDEEIDELLLVGYIAINEIGFALPCYANRPRANAWYSAICSIEGDHAGTVVGFELLADARVEGLPDALHRSVRVGDPWHDVFVLGGQAYVGPPGKLLSELSQQFEALSVRAPLTALDLALAAGEDDVRGLVLAARRYLERRHGVAIASAWYRDLLISEARLTVRRSLAEAGASSRVLAEARPLTLVQAGESLIVQVSQHTKVELADLGLEINVSRRIRQVGQRVGAELELLSQVTEKPATLPVTGPWTTKAYWPGADARILVVSMGARARNIARHINPPDWIPVPHAPEGLQRWIVGLGRPSDGAGRDASVIDVIDEDRLPTSDDSYSAVVWLLDDRRSRDGHHAALVRGTAETSRWDDAAVHLLAPALPLQGPSKILAAVASEQPVRLPYHCVIDTSLARSPFWTGNPWRAIDRRVADTIVSAALLAATEGPIRDELLAAGVTVRNRLLSVALGSGDLDGPDPELGLVSEASATGLVDTIGKRLDVGFGLTPLDKSVRGNSRGYASLRPADSNFNAFAESVVSMAIASRLPKKAGIPVRRSQVPRLAKPEPGLGGHEVRRALDFPEWAAKVALEGKQALFVTAEAPSLEVVRRAWSAGCGVARYTDEEALQEILEGRSTLSLPRELHLPRLNRLSLNRGLVVRGVDPRDIVRFPLELLESWQSQWNGSAFAELGRRYLARLDGPMSAALPRADLVRAVKQRDPAALAFAAALGNELAIAEERPPKRPADLRVAWRSPEVGTRRFLLEDGRLPVSMLESPPLAVPAQRMFSVDGDDAVPIFFGSRIFSIWAQATMSRSTSWLARFSVGGTFETAPIPELMQVVREGSARPRLIISPDAFDLLDLSAYIATETRGRWSRTAEGSEQARLGRAWEEVDALLLESIDLAPEANVLEILERLLEMATGLNHEANLQLIS